MAGRELSPSEVGENVGTPAGKGLKAGALGFASSAVIAVASVGPGVALASALATLLVVGGLQTAGLVLLGAIPVLLTIAAFKGLHEDHPDCGTTFVWVGRILGPTAGFLSGWALLGAAVMSMPGMLSMSAFYGLSLFGVHDPSKPVLLFIGLVIAVALSAAAYFGVEGAAKLQRMLCIIELILIAVLLAVLLWFVATGNVQEGADSFSLSWFNPFSLTLSQISLGLVLAVTAFYGWDVAFTLGEETDGRQTPGRAAYLSIGVLCLIYVVGVVVVVSYVGVAYSHDNADTLLDLVAATALGTFGGKLIVLAVLTSGLAAMQATVILASRQLLAMGSFRALPKVFARVNKFQCPSFSTVFVGSFAVVFMVILSLISDNVLNDSLSATGMLVMFYFGATCFACAWHFRRAYTTSISALLSRVVGPVIGGAVMIFAFYNTAQSYLNPDNSASQLFGIGSVLVFSGGILVIGLVLTIVLRRTNRAFYSGDSLRFSDAGAAKSGD